MLNPQFNELKREYIFPIIEEKLQALQRSSNREKPLNLGIGDIAKPLSFAVAEAICDATRAMTQQEGLRGYGPHQGYLFLREGIVSHELKDLGITADEIFVSDGINSDAVGVQDLFATSCVVGILDPTYPAYLDATILSGKENIHFIASSEENDFRPKPPEVHCDLIYLCSPSNPTGVAMTRDDLALWVAYAKKEKAILLFDHAYVGFVTSADVPKSIFEIPGAKDCCIEFRSFSKTAGFTGLRCAYAVIPKTVLGSLNGQMVSLHTLWNRRQAAKFNGVAFPIQKGALAVYSPQGQKETQAQVAGYLEEARKLKNGLKALGHTCFGGTDSPYIWWKIPKGMSSWEFFDQLLSRCQLICIPGIGFGKTGEGYVRLSSFILPETTDLALIRLEKL